MAPDQSALRSAIDRLLRLAGTSTTLRLKRKQLDKFYEVYVLGLVAEAVRVAGGSADLRSLRSPNTVPNPVIVRGSPGQIWSTGSDYAYLDCQLGPKHFEGHVAVTFQGNSGATHEIDVSLVDHTHAANARTERLMPRTNQNNLLAAFECKFYSSAPGVVLGRTFSGLTHDCSGTRFKALACNNEGDGLSRFLSRTSEPENMTGLTPLKPNSEKLFVGALGHALKQWSHGR